MDINRAKYLQSATSLDALPKPTLPEYAFSGRSNVGKSSLINMLCGQSKLAITSSKPGRTQAINHFIIDDKWYLVDLPGYGYAKVSKKEREFWVRMKKRYIKERENLVTLFLLIDIRISPMESDLNFVQMLGENAIPFVILFTKSDQIKQNEIYANLDTFKKELLKTWETLPPMIVTSAKKGLGRKDILAYIEENSEVYLNSLSAK